MKPQEILIKWMRYKATIAKKRSYFTPKDAEVIRGWSDKRALAVVKDMRNRLDNWGLGSCCPFCRYVELFWYGNCTKCGYRKNHKGGGWRSGCGEPYDSMSDKTMENWYSDEAKERFRQLSDET